MPDIVFVTNSFPTLSESFIYNKVCYLKENGYNVTVLIQTASKDRKYYSKESLNRIRIISAPPVNNLLLAALIFLLYSIIYPTRIQRIFKSFNGHNLMSKFKFTYRYFPFMIRKFDIIYFPFSSIGVPYIPLLQLLKKDALIYLSCRGSAEKVKPIINPHRKQELQKLFQLVNRVHCVSQDILEVCIKMGLSPNKAFINRPAINHYEFNNEYLVNRPNNEPIKLITVGRLHWVKYHDFLLLSLSEYQKKGGQFILSIVGNGPEYERLLFMVTTLGLVNCVKFLGPKSSEEVRMHLAESDIYIQTSISEGISNSVMEAMAMSMPVICTDVGGMKELIDDGTDGYLVPLFESEILIQRLNELIKNQNSRVKMGRNARNKILKNFTLEKQCAVFIDEYSTVLNDR